MSKLTIAGVIVGFLIIIVGVVVGWVVIPNVIHSKIGEFVELRTGTDQYERFVELPIPFEFRVFMFNVTNPIETANGAQPILEERGPYIYKEHRLKTILEHTDDTITYQETQHYEFDAEASGDLSDNDMVTVLNPALNGAIQQKLEKIEIEIFKRGIKLAFGYDELFLTISVKDILFDGHIICANVSNSNPICKKILNRNLKNMRQVEAPKLALAFSFFNHKNTTYDGNYTVNNGIERKEMLGSISQWEGSDYLSNMWVGGNNSTCNKVRGRDSVIYPPFIESFQTLTIFNTDICRTADLKFEKELEYRDVTAYRFSIPMNMLDSPDDERGTMCYCLKDNPAINSTNGCVKNGLMELSHCYGATIVLSWPHFLWADEEYQKSSIGMKPDKEKHQTFIDVHPETGTPLRGFKRIQLNMFVRPDKHFKFTEGFRESIIPILWIDEAIEIDDKLYKVLEDAYVNKLIMADGIKWGLIAVGIVIATISFIAHQCMNRSSNKTV